MSSRTLLQLLMFVPSAIFLVIWHLGARAAYEGALPSTPGQLTSDLLSSPLFVAAIGIYLASIFFLFSAIVFCCVCFVVKRSKDDIVKQAIFAGTAFLMVSLPAVSIFLFPSTAELLLKVRFFPVGFITGTILFGSSAMTVVLLKYGMEL